MTRPWTDELVLEALALLDRDDVQGAMDLLGLSDDDLVHAWQKELAELDLKMDEVL